MFEQLGTFFAENLPYIELFGSRINVLSQVAGLVGFILIGIAYQQKKLPFLILSGVAYIVFMGESFFLLGESDTLSNVLGNATSFLRNLLMIFVLVKYNKELPSWASIPFLALYWVGFLLPLFTGAVDSLADYAWYAYLPPIVTTVYSITAFNKNYYVLKGGALFLESVFMFYHPLTGAYVGGIRQAVLVISIIVSIIRMYRADKAKAQIAALQTDNATPGDPAPSTCSHD